MKLVGILSVAVLIAASTAMAQPTSPPRANSDDGDVLKKIEQDIHSLVDNSAIGNAGLNLLNSTLEVKLNQIDTNMNNYYKLMQSIVLGVSKSSPMIIDLVGDIVVPYTIIKNTCDKNTITDDDKSGCGPFTDRFCKHLGWDAGLTLGTTSQIVTKMICYTKKPY